MNEFRIAVPPPDERHAIVTHLENVLPRIDSLIGKTLAAIDRLNEYRCALITDTVTGKVDIRGEVAG